MNRNTLNLVAKEVLASAGSLIGTIVAFGFVVFLLSLAAEHVWALPVVAVLLGCSLLYMGAQDLTSGEAQHYPMRKGLAIFVLMVLIASAVFGAFSLSLARWEKACYGGNFPEDLATFSGYYLWLFLDMIPALEITDTLGLTTPVEPTGLVAGMPVLSFRILVLYGLLRVFRVWWKSRRFATRPPRLL